MSKYKMISVDLMLLRKSVDFVSKRFRFNLVFLLFIICILKTFVHLPGAYAQTSLILHPTSYYIDNIFHAVNPPFINFSTRINTEQVSYYPLQPSFQTSTATLNGATIHNIPYSLPSKSFSLPYPSLIQVLLERSIESSSQGVYSSLFANNNSLSLFLTNRNSTASSYYPINFSSFPSYNTGNFDYNTPFAPFNPFVNGSRSLNLYGPIDTNPTNRIIPEILIPAASVPVYYTYKIINIYPHDHTAFTQGLVYEDGFLYEGTGISGRSTLRKVDLETGNVLQSMDLSSQYFGEGITIFGERIVQLTWLHNMGFVYDKTSFELLQEFYYPTEGWGITQNGKSLIMSDGTSTLHFLDPLTFSETGFVEVYDKYGPVSFLNELEYIQGEIYANIYKTDRIARISPSTGKVLGWIDLKGLLSPEYVVSPIDVLNGIAYDSKLDRLFVTGKFWPKLFEIDVVNL